MGERNDGGPAFPVRDANRLGHTYCVASGMTLRDWFAGHALAGLSSSTEVMKAVPMGPGNLARYLASMSYEFADAMLKARES